MALFPEMDCFYRALVIELPTLGEDGRMLTVHFEEDEDEEGQPHKRRILLSHVFKKSSSSNYSLRPCLSRSLSCYLSTVGRSS